MYLYGPKQKSNYVCAEVRVGDKWFLCVMGDFLLIWFVYCVYSLYTFLRHFVGHIVS